MDKWKLVLDSDGSNFFDLANLSLHFKSMARSFALFTFYFYSLSNFYFLFISLYISTRFFMNFYIFNNFAFDVRMWWLGHVS